MKKILLSLLILSSSTSTFVSSTTTKVNNKTSQTIITAIYHTGFAFPVALGTYRYLNADNILKNNFFKLTDKKIINFVQDACSKIINHKVNIYTGDARYFGLPATGYFAAAVGDNSIIIEPSYYQVVKEYFLDETKENRELVLKIFNFLIQHEAGHLKNQDSKHLLQRAIVIYLLKVALFEASKKTGIKFKASQLLTYLSLNIIDTGIQSYFNIQQEYRADTSVVGQDAVEGGKQFFTNLINFAQNNPAADLAMKLDFNHPTPENRLKRLQELE